MIKRFNLIFWIVVALIFFIILIMHPRIYYGIILLICIAQCISMLRQKNKQNKISKKTILGIISIIIVLNMRDMLNVIYPYHAIYEYKNDIQNLKNKDVQGYGHFPDEIPNTATQVKWVCMPNLIQGSGYEALFLYADDLYIEKIYNKYSLDSIIYEYKNYGWMNEEEKKSISFPKVNDILEQDKENIVVMIRNDKEDINNPHNSGIYMNQVEGYVCFFAQ